MSKALTAQDYERIYIRGAMSSFTRNLPKYVDFEIDKRDVEISIAGTKICTMKLIVGKEIYWACETRNHSRINLKVVEATALLDDILARLKVKRVAKVVKPDKKLLELIANSGKAALIKKGKQRKCGLCRELGHNRRTCPQNKERFLGKGGKSKVPPLKRKRRKRTVKRK